MKLSAREYITHLHSNNSPSTIAVNELHIEQSLQAVYAQCTLPKNTGVPLSAIMREMAL